MDYNLILFISLIILFFVLVFFGKKIHKKIENSDNRYLNPFEYLPEEEVHSEKQLFYLAMIVVLFIMFLYSIVYTHGDLLLFAIVEVVLSLYLAITLDLNSYKNIFVLVLLIPFGCFCFFSQEYTFILLDFAHNLVFLYFIKVYYDKFNEYTQTHSLGFAMLLLFLIIFASFIVTSLTEDASPLDSLVMVSNAFTSNGYTVLGHTTIGKLNSIILVWGGFLLSGVGTATLTAAILTRHFNKKFEELEELIKKE